MKGSKHLGSIEPWAVSALFERPRDVRLLFLQPAKERSCMPAVHVVCCASLSDGRKRVPIARNSRRVYCLTGVRCIQRTLSTSRVVRAAFALAARWTACGRANAPSKAERMRCGIIPLTRKCLRSVSQCLH